MFLAGVETREAGPLGWWSSERLVWVLAAVCCRSDQGEFDLILGIDLVLGLCFGFTVRRRKGKGK